jgi:uncharacterized protein
MWEPWNAPGAEVLTLTVDSDGAVAQGTMIRLINGEPELAQYVVHCDAAWRTQEVRVTARGRTLTLGAKQLGAADDVDIYACAFTNTLPIRRTNYADDFTINAIFITLPDLRVERAAQRYTRIGPNAYRYAGLDSGFTSEITIDEDGVVVDYTSVVRRVWPPHAVSTES